MPSPQKDKLRKCCGTLQGDDPHHIDCPNEHHHCEFLAQCFACGKVQYRYYSGSPDVACDECGGALELLQLTTERGVTFQYGRDGKSAHQKMRGRRLRTTSGKAPRLKLTGEKSCRHRQVSSPNG
jgi:hypothetical protein